MFDREKRKKEKKKEDEKNRNFHVRFSRVDLATDLQRDEDCKFFPLLCFVFLGTAPTLYVQATILNQSHFYLRSTSMLPDDLTFHFSKHLIFSSV